uniref:Peptidase S8 n=1 Tax=Hirondellea gigas TaxID=1518452 RepID=A0A6A7G9Q9_9CRUS
MRSELFFILALVQSSDLQSSENVHPKNAVFKTADYNLSNELLISFETKAFASFATLQKRLEERNENRVTSERIGDQMVMLGSLTSDELQELERKDGVHIQNNFEYSVLDQFYPIPEQTSSDRSDSSGFEPAHAWGIDRIDQYFLPLNGVYQWSSKAENVYAFILDTGVNSNHPEWKPKQISESICCMGKACVPLENDQDVNGHGTHVAGIIGSKSFGIAKDITIISVRVLGSSGKGTTISIARGFTFVMDYLQRYPSRKLVVNLSLGSKHDKFLNNVVNKAWKKGVVIVAAAGNEEDDACKYSPSSANGVITAGASTIGDSPSSFSNYGRCVHIFAPGSHVRSLNSKFLTEEPSKLISGTSMASPHVAGVAAIILSLHPEYSPDNVRDIIINSSRSAIHHELKDTTKRLLHAFGVPGARSHSVQRSNVRIVTLATTGGFLAFLLVVAAWWTLRRQTQLHHQRLRRPPRHPRDPPHYRNRDSPRIRIDTKFRNNSLEEPLSVDMDEKIIPRVHFAEDVFSLTICDSI